MFGPELQGQDAGLPSEVIHAFTSVEAVYRGVLKRGSEDRTFKIPQNDPAALEMAAIGAWSLVHGLAMLYIDGLATLETAQTMTACRRSHSDVHAWRRKARKTGLGSIMDRASPSPACRVRVATRY